MGQSVHSNVEVGDINPHGLLPHSRLVCVSRGLRTEMRSTPVKIEHLQREEMDRNPKQAGKGPFSLKVGDDHQDRQLGAAPGSPAEGTDELHASCAPPANQKTEHDRPGYDRGKG